MMFWGFVLFSCIVFHQYLKKDLQTLLKWIRTPSPFTAASTQPCVLCCKLIYNFLMPHNRHAYDYHHISYSIEDRKTATDAKLCLFYRYQKRPLFKGLVLLSLKSMEKFKLTSMEQNEVTRAHKTIIQEPAETKSQ